MQQQLAQLCAGHQPSGSEEQLATQQSQTNEQLEALQTECNAVCEAAVKAVAERELVRLEVETSRKANLKLRVASHASKTTGESETTWQDWCCG